MHWIRTGKKKKILHMFQLSSAFADWETLRFKQMHLEVPKPAFSWAPLAKFEAMFHA